ncbi:porin family protein [Rufibacter sp. XAAS-G3-1]|uniref:porin family protein n=1 Tax=Rufibacter sp. XAAS-G3-1 TaxID=2729134 RepID=UPI0015E7334D|nr:porin family protein [Rufibacter sp. XAAS-G3-1]
MNKRFTLLLLYLALTIGGATAQATLIPKAGLSFSDYKLVNTFGNKTKKFNEPGIMAGVALNQPFSKLPWLSVQPELIYMQKKYTSQSYFTIPYPVEADVWFHKTSRTLTYVEIPILVKATLTKGKWLGYGNAGPAIGYAVAGKHTSGNLEENTDFTHSNRLELSAQAGLGLGRAIGRGTLFLDARYSLGLTPLHKAHTTTINITLPEEEPFVADIPLEADHKSRVLSFSVGYAFPLNTSLF